MRKNKIIRTSCPPGRKSGWYVEHQPTAFEPVADVFSTKTEAMRFAKIAPDWQSIVRVGWLSSDTDIKADVEIIDHRQNGR